MSPVQCSLGQDFSWIAWQFCRKFVIRRCYFRLDCAIGQELVSVMILFCISLSMCSYNWQQIVWCLWKQIFLSASLAIYRALSDVNCFIRWSLSISTTCTGQRRYMKCFIGDVTPIVDAFSMLSLQWQTFVKCMTLLCKCNMFTAQQSVLDWCVMWPYQGNLICRASSSVIVPAYFI